MTYKEMDKDEVVKVFENLSRQAMFAAIKYYREVSDKDTVAKLTYARRLASINKAMNKLQATKNEVVS